MPQPAPRPLPENAGLAWVGERLHPAAVIPAARAREWLSTRNPQGRPNADVVRPSATFSRARIRAGWLVDFPPGMDEREASLYEKPFLHLQGMPATPSPNPALRTALARRERYLATPLGAGPPAWTWLDSTIIPGDTLLAVARDDDFAQGILSGRPFALWWRKFHPWHHPALAVESYPFPWSPRAGLSALTAAQEEGRLAVARAARRGDAESLNAAVAAAYGWPADLGDDALLAHLVGLNRTRPA